MPGRQIVADLFSRGRLDVEQQGQELEDAQVFYQKLEDIAHREAARISDIGLTRVQAETHNDSAIRELLETIRKRGGKIGTYCQTIYACIGPTGMS